MATKAAITAVLASLLGFSPLAQATAVPGQGTWETTLQPRDIDGDGVVDAYYDTDLDITWLADANARAGEGLYADGATNWVTAQSWAAALDVHGITGWRMPKVTPIDGDTFDYTQAYDGSADLGWNISAPGTVFAGSGASELAHLFFVTLGNQAYYDTVGEFQIPGFGLTNTGPFENVEPWVYWTSTEYGGDHVAANGHMYFAWHFSLYYGWQTASAKGWDGYYAWAVRDGDVSDRAEFIAVTSIPNSPSPRLATLMIALDGTPRVIIRDSNDKRITATLEFGDTTYRPLGLATLPSGFAGTPPELAVLFVRPNGAGQVQVVDPMTGELLRTFNFFNEQWHVRSITAQDLDHDGVAEISVLGVRDDGLGAAIQIRDSITGAQLNWIPVPVR